MLPCKNEAKNIWWWLLPHASGEIEFTKAAWNLTCIKREVSDACLTQESRWVWSKHCLGHT